MDNNNNIFNNNYKINIKIYLKFWVGCVKILQRYLHYVNPYVSIIGHTNLYIYPGTKNSRNDGGK